MVTPTRELALQVSKDLTVAAKHRKARVLTVYGGVGYDTQLDALAARVEVVVGTPGRLLDLADRRSLDLSHIKVLVLDEADEMLDLGSCPTSSGSWPRPQSCGRPCCSPRPCRRRSSRWPERICGTR